MIFLIAQLAFYLFVGLIVLCVISFFFMQLVKGVIMWAVIWGLIFGVLGVIVITMGHYIAGGIAIMFAILPMGLLEK